MLIRNLGTLNANITADTKKLNQDLKEGEKKFKGFSDSTAKALRPVGLALTAVGAAAIGMTAVFVKSSIRFEQLMKGLNSVAGSADEAAKQLKTLREVAKLPGLGLEEAVRASINLQAVRFSAEKAAFFITEMGNALATVGAGRAELAGVIRGMQQMQSRGKVLAEEINQISERVPQFRAAMLDAFGTATSEEIQKMGITVEEFLTKTVNQLAKLPRVAGGAANAIENLRDAAAALSVSFGDVLLPTVTRAIDGLAGIVARLNNLTDTQKSLITWTLALGGTGAGLIGGIILLGSVLPAFNAGLATLSGIAFGPIGIGFAAVAAGIALTAGALKAYKDASKDVFFEEEFKRQQGNIEGIEQAIRDHEESLNRLKDAYQTVKNGGIIPFDESLLLAKAGLRGIGTDVEKFIPAIAAMEKTLRDTKIELIQTKGGTLAYAVALVDGKKKTEDVATASADLSGVIKLMFNPLEQLNKLLKFWDGALFGVSMRTRENVSLTRASLKDLNTVMREAWDERLKIVSDNLDEEADARQKSVFLDNEIASKAADKNASLVKKRVDGELEEFNRLGLSKDSFRQEEAANEQQAFDDSVMAADVHWGRVIAKQEEMSRKRVRITEITWQDTLNATATGMNALTDAWTILSGNQDSFHETWLSKMADWVTDIANLLNDLTTAWKSAMTIINKVAQFVGGDGGTAGALAGLASGGGTGVGTLGKVGGAASGVGAFLGKVGGGIKAGAGAAASGIGSGVSAVGGVAGVGVLAGGALVAANIGGMVAQLLRGRQFTSPSGLGLSQAGTGNTVSDLLRQIRNEQFRSTDPFLSTHRTDPSLLGRSGPVDVLSREFGLAGSGGGTGGAAGVERIVAKLDQILQAISQPSSPVSQQQIGSALWELVGPSARRGGFV